MSLHFTTATRVSLFFLTAVSSASLQAADGTIHIRGAVSEPACSVSTAAFGFGRDVVQRVSQARNVAAMPLELNMHCNARQAIQLRMIQSQDKTRAGFDTGMDGVHMLLQHEGRVVAPGEAMSISLPQHMTHQIRMEARLEAEARKTNPTDVKPAPSKAWDGGRMLVAIDYL